MTTEEIHSEYQQIKSSWRAHGFAERAQHIARLRDLSHAAHQSLEGGTELLEVEIDDLIVQISRPSAPPTPPPSTEYLAPSDQM